MPLASTQVVCALKQNGAVTPFRLEGYNLICYGAPSPSGDAFDLRGAVLGIWLKMT